MVSVHLLPSMMPPGALRGGVAVVIDVLRASTTIVHALTHGCAMVIPCAEIDEARRVAAGLPAGTALLGGERHGEPIAGFDLGNSPGDYTTDVCRGKTLVMTTTNGTRALLASLEAETVLVGAFVNFASTVQRLIHEERPVHLVCAGTEGRVSYEDALLAGAFASRFADLEHDLGNDEAEIARGLWERVQETVWAHERHGGRPGEEPPLVRYLKRGAGGRRVVELGLGDDVELAGTLNRTDCQTVVELARDPLRLVASD
ncbi:2-phosphosulfolactate phosphatase [Planctomyces sp. SH-PL62]|uniref:2-phosphosulfolactate phosphatase n=1 Tax=Planctomyces sp. SH-PL62 TaxID=1636152 RepID=UPI00078B6827|nr:2-phosphosulfolactate phosphatase [Planctomyces sp. SH-PL62]AMV37711.1 putative 2-phosphosulfolactate phosphatase [Planctomyces sp. SH-PL62]